MPAVTKNNKKTPEEARKEWLEKSAGSRAALSNWRPTVSGMRFMAELVDTEAFDGFFFGSSGYFTGPRAGSFRLGTKERMTASAAHYTTENGPGGQTHLIFFSAPIFRRLQERFGADPNTRVSSGGFQQHSLTEAYLCTMQHEMLHMYVRVRGFESTEHGPVFRRLSAEKLGQHVMSHNFETPKTIARVEKGVRVNSIVKFDFKGQRIVGRVDSIRKNATVYREDRRYSVPVECLTLLTPEEREKEGALPQEVRKLRMRRLKNGMIQFY